MSNVRNVETIIEAKPASDGAGVQLKRIMSQPPHQLMDPFLMLDELKADNPDTLGGGFPSHPHRGIETISFMLAGGFRHEDHMGNCREVGNGGMQWMKSGRGVIHSEMPLPDNNKLHGFQIWLNMSRSQKMDDPQYRDINADDIPELDLPGGKCQILLGSLLYQNELIKGPVIREQTQALMLNVTVNKNEKVLLPVTTPKVMVYVYRGVLNVSSGSSVIAVPESSLAVLTDSGDLEVSAENDCGFILLGGQPLNEPVVQSGPFVMNSYEEIQQAVRDYQDGVLV